jgi:hypothetical protein
MQLLRQLLLLRLLQPLTPAVTREAPDSRTGRLVRGLCGRASGYFFPWFLTASMAAAAASGSR